MTKALTVALALGSLAAPLAGTEDPRGSERLPFKEVKLLIEHNATDEDTGFQLFVDGEPWRSLEVEDPDGRTLLEVRPRAQLRNLGLTELFFETNEPSNEDVPIRELLARFPEGEYEFEGRSTSGEEMSGVATLTHTIPRGPRILSPEPDEVVDPEDAVVRWEPVTQSITGGPVTIVAYEVIVTKPVDPPPPGFSKLVLSAHVPGEVTRLTLPTEFLQAATAYDLEVLALEEGGNQTISSSRFVTK